MTLSPGAEPGGGARISTLSGVEAHITIASDTMPLENVKINCLNKELRRF